MTMKLTEYNKLRKLMMMTTSDNDQEVITAVRAANKILSAHGYDWNASFDRLVKVQGAIPDFEEAPEEKDERTEIREAFEEVESSNLSGDFADFIASLREQFDRRGSLSIKQKDALLKARDKARGWR